MTVTVTVSGQSGSLASGFTYVVIPTVTSVSPNTGSTAGGTAVTITGTNFATGATVTFGGTAATNVVVVSGTSITATTPAGTAGPVTVTVTVSGQSGSLASGFTYVATPTVTGVSPNTGTTAGGTSVTITGTNFVAGATVTVGGAAATNVVVVSGTSITAKTPAGTAGPVTVTVTVSGQSGSLASGFTYVVIPTVTSVSPNSGSTTGGTGVTITGTNFAAGATVTFGGTAATNVVVVSGTSITATTPAGTAGPVTVTVTVSGQSGSLASGFTYVATPTVTGVSPNTGTTAGGTSVTITGTNFAAGATVTVGGTAATSVVVVSGTSITAKTPAGSAGPVTVTVTVSGQSGSLASGFTYVVTPSVTSVSPNSGSTTGGTGVTITGTNFAAGATVTFGGTAATNVVVVSGTSITATTPAGTAGPVTVTVTVSGQSGSLASGFTYVATPTVTSLSPNTGTTAGGTGVTITGTNFAAGATVTVGGAAATSVVVVSGTSITATTPAGTAGPVTVTVTVSGQSGSLASGFTYVVTPSVTSVAPNSGTTAGGTSVTITGTNFAAGATVTFGGTAATNVVVVSGTSITATTPAGSAGPVTVTVTVSGQSGSLASGFTYVATPTVTGVSPNTGTTAGGTSITITGTNFVASATVTVGGAAATSVVVVSGTSITAKTPAGTAGPVTVTVTVSGQSGSLASGFTYVVTPSVTSVAPNSGTTAGGTSVTITGTNFAAGATVTFGGTAATNVVVVSGTSITATTPAGSAGPVTVTVTVSGQSGSLASGFTYVATPTMTSLSPNTGTTAGGTSVTITGTNFASGATVTFGATAATNVVVVSGTSITATTPAGTAGPVTVTVTVSGQSGSLTNGFTYVAPTSITYVQGNSATPQSSATTVSVTFTAAQQSGDLNVIVVGWNNSTATVTNVTDKSGNQYLLAVGPTIQSPVASQSIYYAKNILAASAGTNSVTVTFSAAAAYPDIRILEYSGADQSNPVDVTAANTGNSATSSSGSVTTTYPSDLLFGANLVQSSTSGPGSGFTKRLLTSPDGDIAEDEMVSAVGSYSATAPINSGQWIMQMVAFRTSSGGAPVLQSIAITPANPSIAVGVQQQFTATGTYSDGSKQSLTSSATWTSSLPSTATINSAGLATAVAAGSTTIQATVGSINGSTTLTVTQSNFTVGASPTSLTVSQGNQGISTITTTISGGFNSAIALSAAGMPTGTTVSFNPTTIPAPGSGTSTMTFTVGSSTPLGTYSITVTGNGGGIQQSANVMLTVTVASPCSNTNLGNGITCVAVVSASNVTGLNVSSLSAGALNVLPGDSLVAEVRYEAGEITGGGVSVETSAGDTLLFATGTTGNGGAFATQIFYICGAIANAASTPSVYFSASQAYASIVVHQYRGLVTHPASNSCLDVTATGTAKGTSVTSKAFTTTQPNEVSFAVGAVNNFGVTFTAGAGYTLVATDPGGQTATEQAAFTSIQTGATASMSFASNPAAIAVATFIAGTTNVGSGIPVGHGVAVWAAVNDTSATCSGLCILKVTDSKGNSYSTLQTNDQPSVNVTNFLAFGNITTALAGDGSDWVKCSFYFHDGVTPVNPLDYTYCRVFDLSQVASSGVVDSSNQNTDSNSITDSGPLTVTNGNTDLIFAIWDISSTTVTVTPGSGFTGVLFSLDGGGGEQYAEFAQSTVGLTPGITLSSGSSTYGAGMAVKESSPGGAVMAVNSQVGVHVNSSSLTLQIPQWYIGPGGDTQPPTAPGNLTATAVSVSQINLSWTASTDNIGVTSYLVERCQGAGCANFLQIATPTTLTFSDTGLATNASYSYRVRATDAAGNLSQYSNIATTSTLSANVPTAPANLAAVGGGPVPIVLATQSYINTTFLTSHTTAAFDSSGGDLIVLSASSHSGVALTPSDSFANTWIPISGPTNTSAGGFDLRTQLWYAQNPVVGPGHTVTLSLSAAQPLVISVLVVKGSNISAPIDAVSLIGNDNGTKTINVASPSITTTAFNDLLIGFVKVSSGTSFQSGTGFTQQASASSNFLDAETGPAATPGSYAATFTLGAQETWESAVVAAASNPNQTTLSWTASTEAGGTISQYLVERCQGAGCGNFAQIGTTTTTTFSDAGLTPSTSYSYRVRAEDTANNLGAYSSVVTVATPSTTSSTPSAPANLTASGPTVIAGQSYVGPTSSASQTTSPFDSTGGDLLVMSASSFAGVTMTPSDSFSNTWTSIAGPTSTSSGTNLITQVWYAQNPTVGAGHTVTMHLSAAEPLTISIVVVKGSNGSSPIDAASAIATDNGTQVSNVASPSITTTSMNDLLIGFTQVSSGAGFLTGPGFTEVGASSSLYLEAQTSPAPMPGSYAATSVINVAQNWLTAVVAATNNPNHVSLSWTPSAETGGNQIGGTISQYLVERCQGSGCSSFTQIGTATGTTFNDTGLSAETSYSYRVRAEDSASTFSPYSSVVTVVPSGSLPSAPGNLQAEADRQGPILLTWSASTGTLGIANYIIQRCQGSGCSNFAQVGTATGTTYTDSAVVASTTYCYRVQAKDTAGNLSPFSTVATITTVGNQPPTAPTNLTATPVSISQISLSWTASQSSIGLANYVVQRCQGAGCSNFAQVATPVGTTYSDSGLSPNTSYSYQVEAIDIEGNFSPFSNVASAVTTSASTTITYVQGAYATPQSSQTSVTVTFTAAQTAGNLNVVVVGWNSSTSSVTSVTDKSGNQYLLAVGPTVQSPVASQSIYYAKSIASAAAGANSVTVTFASAAAYPDIRILEYKGADPSNPFDVAAASTGTGSSASSGPATTNNATDLIFGASMIQTVTSGPGAGFTTRLLTSPDSDIAEDEMVTTTGSYSATSTVSSGQWIMQMVAFRASGSCAGGLPPVPGNLTVTPASSSQMTLTWNASVTCVGIAHYVVQRCQGAGCTNFAQVGTPTGTIFNDTGLPANTSFSYQLQAVDNAGNSSAFTSVVSATTLAISITPRFTDVTLTQTQQFTSSAGVTWSVDGVAGGSASTGTVSSTGLYTPPNSVGTHTVTATTSDQHSASATVYVTNYPGTYTYHNDNLRTGQNLNETTLTLSNVNQYQFGKLLSYPLDGMAYASPLYVASVNIPGKGFHNVVYVATENDSVYAFDADGLSASPLWQVSFLKSGVTTVPCSDTGECGDILTQIGITSTPVIDSTSGTIYVVAATKEGASTWVQRLHALDITTGAEKFGGPVVLQGSVTGTGTGSSGGKVPFDSLRENQRPGLLLSNGVVYLAFGSHGDNSPWHGWVLGYNATSLQQQTLQYNATANGNGGGIWQGGGGLATDATGDIYFVTSNGDFDANSGGVDYGDTVEKLSPSGTVVDYFTPHDQQNMSANNLDLGAGGPVMLVDQPTGSYPHLLITAGKNGTIYVVNRDNMGKYNANNDNQIVQSLPGVLPNGSAESGNFSTPVFFNSYVYFGAINDTIKAFQLTNGLLAATPASQTATLYQVRGASFALSANGSSNGILWALQNNGSSANTDNVGNPGVLFAYDANNLGTELYDTTQAGSRDTLDLASKFSIPLVANGKVFVAGQTQLTVFGLLP